MIRNVRTAAAASACMVSAFALVTMAPVASGDSVVAVPDDIVRGDRVTIVKTKERARVGPSLAANGAGRTVWVSGNVKVDAPGIDTREAGPFNFPEGEDAMPGSNGNSSTGAAASLSVGYVVGCQVEIGRLGGAAEGALSTARLFDTAGGSVDGALSPGRVVYAQIERKQLTNLDLS